MKNLNLILFALLLSFSANAQQYEKLTKAEKTLIKTNSGEMMRVYNLGNPGDSIVLKSVSKPINPKDKMSRLLANRMLMSVKDPSHTGVGIAAPQVGINRRMIVVQRFDKDNKPFEVFVNPEISYADNIFQLGPEGDLSFEERGSVMRHFEITVSYYTLDGELKRETIQGFTAVIFQHERDHLDGTLLTDRIEEQKNIRFVPIETKTGLYRIDS